MSVKAFAELVVDHGQMRVSVGLLDRTVESGRRLLGLTMRRFRAWDTPAHEWREMFAILIANAVLLRVHQARVEAKLPAGTIPEWKRFHRYLMERLLS